MGDFGIGAGLGFLGTSLLGGGGGGGVSGQSTQQLPRLTYGQQQLLTGLTSRLRSELFLPGRVPPSELGPPGPSPLQQQAFGVAGQLPQQMAFDPQAIQGAMEPVGQYAQNLFEQQLAPSAMAIAGQQGTARGSGVLDRLGRIGAGLSSDIAAQFGPMQFAAQQAAQQRQLQVPGMMQNIGAIQRGIPAEQQAFERERFMGADPFRNPALQYLPTALGTIPFDVVQQPGFRQPSMMESMLPALGTLGGSIFGAAGQAGGFSNLFGY